MTRPRSRAGSGMYTVVTPAELREPSAVLGRSSAGGALRARRTPRRLSSGGRRANFFRCCGSSGPPFDADLWRQSISYKTLRNR
eukprot:10045976-Heterocapsa_arctica.AAC.1